MKVHKIKDGYGYIAHSNKGSAFGTSIIDAISNLLLRYEPTIKI